MSRKEATDEEYNRAVSQLIDITNRIEEVQQNTAVEDYAADEYLDEATEKIKAAVADLELGKRED